ncbi:MAG: hypothetical protein R2755_11190 [Acidimicrobiales bacterium]
MGALVRGAAEETHHVAGTPLSYLRSPHPDRSWITAAGAILDTAAMRMAVLDLPFRSEGGLCIRSGTLALRSVSDLLGVAYPADPQPGSPHRRDPQRIRRGGR